MRLNGKKTGGPAISAAVLVIIASLVGCRDQQLTIPIETTIEFGLDLSGLVHDFERQWGITLPDTYPESIPRVAFDSVMKREVRLSEDSIINDFSQQVISVKLDSIALHIDDGENGANIDLGSARLWIGPVTAEAIGDRGTVPVAELSAVGAGEHGIFPFLFTDQGLSEVNRLIGGSLDFRCFIKSIIILSGGDPKPTGRIEGRFVVRLTANIKF